MIGRRLCFGSYWGYWQSSCEARRRVNSDARRLLRQFVQFATLALHKMSKLQEAIDYFYAHPGCSKNSAATQCGVAASNLFVALQKHDADVAVFDSVGVDRLNAIDAWFGGNPMATVNTAAKQFNIDANTLRAAYRGQAVVARRLRLAKEGAPVYSVAEMREKCAMLAEAIGGEHGAHIAAAIRRIL